MRRMLVRDDFLSTRLITTWVCLKMWLIPPIYWHFEQGTLKVLTNWVIVLSPSKFRHLRTISDGSLWVTWVCIWGIWCMVQFRWRRCQGHKGELKPRLCNKSSILADDQRLLRLIPTLSTGRILPWWRGSALAPDVDFAGDTSGKSASWGHPRGAKGFT